MSQNQLGPGTGNLAKKDKSTTYLSSHDDVSTSTCGEQVTANRSGSVVLEFAF